MPSDLPEIPLVVRYPLLNRETSLIKDWSIDSAFLTSTDGFHYTLYDEIFDNMRDLELQPVELVLDGASQLIGRNDVSECGDDGMAVRFRGRDYIADMVECNVDPGLKVKLGDALMAVIKLAASPVGITEVLSDEDIAMHTVRSGKRPPKSGGGGKKKKRKKSHKGIKLNDFKPEPGQGIYDFLNKIVAREGATMQPGPNRNTIVLAEPTYDQDPLYGIARSRTAPSGSRNNIQSANAVRDFSRFPTYTLMNGQQARGGERSANVHKVFDLWAIAAAFRSELGRILSDVTVSDRWLPGKVATEVKSGRLYRLLVYRDEVARDAEQVEKAAKRAIAERLKDTLVYTATLRGHADPETGAIYSVDTLINVDDEICNVHEPLWIAERTLEFSESSGATTRVTCWRPESFQLGETFDAAALSDAAKRAAKTAMDNRDAHPDQDQGFSQIQRNKDQDQGLSQIRGDEGFSKIQR